LYSIGWTFEKDIKVQDSALYYYQLLIDKYPKSEYARDVNVSVAYMLALRSGQPIPDSLQRKAYVPRKKFDPVKGEPGIMPEPPRPPKLSTQKSFNPMDILKDPTKALKDTWNGAKDSFNETKDKITNPENLVPDMNLPTDPSKFLKLEKAPSDSTKVNVEEPKK
jgi:hypothetical protein